MASKKPTLNEILEANKHMVIGLLCMPLVGMVISIGLILYQQPGNLMVALGVIVFLMVQYSATIYYIIRRMYPAKSKTKEEDQTEAFID